MTSQASSLSSSAADADRAGVPSKAEGGADPPTGRFGIKAKLFLAVCSLAGLTAIASAVAWYVFGDIGRSVTRVTSESLPGVVAALSLAEKSSDIAITAPALMASSDQAERVREQLHLQQRTEELAALIDSLGSMRAAPELTDRLLGLRQELTLKLEELNSIIESRLGLKSQREARLEAVAEIHARFLNQIEPLVDDAVFDLVISGEQVTAESTAAITNLVDGGVGLLDHLLSINAEANLVAGILAEAIHVRDRELIQPIRERFDAAAAAIERNMRRLPEEVPDKELRTAVDLLLGFGRGDKSVFDRHAAVLGGDTEKGAKSSEDLQGLAAAIKGAREKLLTLLIPLIDDAAFDLVMTTGEVTERSSRSITELVDVGAQLLHVLLTVRAEANLAAGLLNQAASASDERRLAPLQERFAAAEGQIVRIFDSLPSSLDAVDLIATTSALLDMGKASDGIFALRRRELRQIAGAQAALNESRALTDSLSEEVAGLVSATRDESQAAAARSAEAIAGGKLTMLILTGAGILGAAMVMFYYVGPRIIRPLENVTHAMTELAAGDTSVDIPGRDRHDELGRMARALGVFRDTAIEVQESNLKEIGETRRRLSEAIESIDEAFSLYDGDDRLVVCNSKYRSLLYPDMSDEIVPGMTFEAIVRRAIGRGYIKNAEEDPEAWLASRLAQHRNPGEPQIQQRGDGRWILVSERKTDDGGTVAVYSDITELKQREQELSEKSKTLEQLSNQLAKYLSPQVYESIFTGRQEVKLASQRKKLTVFFSDIAGFTETADRLESEELTELLNHYLTEMSRIALDHGATIDKYVGDAIVIFFGDPESRGTREDARACVRMAIEMRDRMLDLESDWRDSGIEKPLKCRIGINTGFCTVGNFGSEDRMDYTIIGGGVNLASRLESAATPGDILISYETYALVRDEIECEERGEITVKGIAYPVATYRVVDRYTKLEKGPRRIREDRPNLKLTVDPDAMSEAERGEATVILQRVLKEIASSR